MARSNFTVLLALVVLIYITGCASTKEGWRIARANDSIESYELFLKEHPSGLLSDSARHRISEIEAEQQLQQEWERTRDSRNAGAYISFVYNNSMSPMASEAIQEIKRVIQDRGEELPAEDSRLVNDNIISFLRNKYRSFSGNLMFQELTNDNVVLQVVASDVFFRDGLICFRRASIRGGPTKFYESICEYGGKIYTLR